MTNPTSNFGWVMPTTTDLVTDLPADFAVFGQAVDTSMAGLKGGTTGQILSKTSNTDMAFTWTAANPGDITAVTAGTGISGGGTSGDVTVTNSMATALTTKGDLTPATGSAAFARLGVGANDTVLTADSTAATGLKWSAPASGGMTLISTTTLTGASVTVSSIPATYNNLYIVVKSFIPATDGAQLQMRFNADATASRHKNNYNFGETAALTFSENNIQISGSTDNGTGNGICTVFIPDYTNTTTWKTSITSSVTPNSTTPTSAMALNSLGYYNQTGAVSSLQFLCSAGNLTSGSVLLYGVK